MATDQRGSVRALLVLVLFALLGGAVVVGPAQPAQAATSLTLHGHGYGHGRGMGQWGAYGYALNHGWPHTTILSHFYGGTRLGSEPNTTISVRLSALDGRDLVVTSGRPFTVGGIRVAAGSAAVLSIRSDGRFTLTTRYSCGGPNVWSTVIASSRVLSTVPDSGDDLSNMLSVCLSSEARQYRGELALVNSSGAARTVNTVYMEEYLRGVVPHEVPASWSDGGGGSGASAVRAQAVAARSYAYAENRSSYAKTCDTTSCQVYGGAGRNGVSVEDPRTTRAVAETHNQVLRDSASGAIVRAEFSSSTGGYTAGGQFPAIRDDGDIISPYHNWTVSFSATQAGAALGVGTLFGFEVTGRNGLGAEGGRVTSVRVSGSGGTINLTGNDVRSRLGLRSDWFTPASSTLPSIYYRDSNTSGVATGLVSYGDPGDVALQCDWDGNGTDTPGVFRGGTWFLSNDGVSAQAVFGFGNPTDQPICGDWEGDGKDSVGVFRNGTFFLRVTNAAGPADGTFGYGNPGDVAVAGNWDGDAYDTVGVFRDGRFFLANSNLAPRTDASLNLGAAGDQPIAGDWNADGRDTVGVFRAGVFYLRNGLTSGPHDLAVAFGGDVGDRAVPGHPNGGRTDTVAIARGY